MLRQYCGKKREIKNQLKNFITRGHRAHLERVEVAHVVHQDVGVHGAEAERVAVVPLGQIVRREAPLRGHVEHHQLPDASVAHQTAAVDRAARRADVSRREVMLEKLLQIDVGERWSVYRLVGCVVTVVY